MKSLYLILLCTLVFPLGLFAQHDSGEGHKKLYDPSANAKADISEAVKKAKEEGKHVFLQIGGNWCRWCLVFDKTVKENTVLNKYMNENYVVYHLNFSKENKNEEVMEDLGFPQRFGFPVFVILDGEGKQLHTQNSAYLEADKEYDSDKIMNFFKNWSPIALMPELYKE